MGIIAGLILICSVGVKLPTGGFVFLKDIETEVHYVTPENMALVKYNYKNTKDFDYIGMGSDHYDMVDVKDLGENRMNCKKKDK